MSYVHIEDTEYRYVWKCTFCFKALPVTYSTPMCTMNLRKFDIALECWILNAKSMATAKLMTAHTVMGNNSPEYFQAFRKIASHYVEKKILPWL